MLNSTIQVEVERLRDAVEDMTNLPSRWNGSIVLMTADEIELIRGRGVFAEKLWGCSILVNTDIAESPMRWRSLLHELLHSVSVGTNEDSYKRLRGWEEAVVEQLQRHFRPLALERLGVHVDAQVFQTLEASWFHNNYIAAMETLRLHLSIDLMTFYLDLLRTPLPDRPAYVRSLDASREFLHLFATASGKLR